MVKELDAEKLISEEAKRLSERYDKDYLDCEDLMKIMGVGKGNIRTLMNRFDFPTTTVGKRKVISVMAFARWSYFQDNRSKF